MTDRDRRLEAPHRRGGASPRIVERSAVLGYRFASWLLRTLPARPTAAVLGLGAQGSYLVWPTKRDWSNRNFGHVLGLPPDDPRVRRVALRAYKRYGSYLVELMRVPFMPREEVMALIEPLDELIDVSEYELLEQPDQFMVHDGVRHGIIFEASNYGMFYNADLITEPPTDFDEFFETAKALTEGETFGLAFRQTEAEEAGVWQDIFNYVYGFGGAWSDGEELTINRAENLEGLEKYQALYDVPVIPKGADAATFRRMFAEGKVGMELNNGGYASATKGQAPDLNFSVAPIPFPVRAQGAILAPIVINAASPAKDAAATFIKWVLEPENQVKLQEILGASSVATTTERSAESLEEMPFLTVFDELTETSLPHVVLGFEARTPDIRKIVVQNVIAALQGEQTMAEALDKAQEEASDLVG